MGLLVYDCAQKSRIGVDIESIDRPLQHPILELAARYFSHAECEQLKNSKLPSDQKKLFLKYWVEKEAYAKATRLGLSKTVSLDQNQRDQSFQLMCMPVIPAGMIAAISIEISS